VIVTEFVSGLSVTARSCAAWADALFLASQDEALWRRLSAGAQAASSRFDCVHFARAAARLAVWPHRLAGGPELPANDEALSVVREVEALAQAGRGRLAG
jgi:hypothetical protein